MDLTKISQYYVDQLVGSDSARSATGLPGSKIKIMLLDKETTSMLSVCATQSQLLKHEIYLIDRIENESREKMRHLKAVVFARPDAHSVESLTEELRSPKYSSYELYFSNLLSKSQLEKLAEADDLEVVTKVQEMYLDYYKLSSHLFSLNLGIKLPKPELKAERNAERNAELSRPVLGAVPDTWRGPALTRTAEGLTALLLSLKMRPVIRYEANSAMAKQLASEIVYFAKQHGKLFEFPASSATSATSATPLLLIIDRRNDPVTPLLTPWTYQSMVHELLGIDNYRVELASASVPPELREVVLSPQDDDFFRRTMFHNFADLGAEVKEYVDLYQGKTQQSKNLQSVQDMKKFVEEYPEFRKLSGNVSKHVAVVGELDARIAAERLWEVSELEQSLACNDQHSADLRELQRLIGGGGGVGGVGNDGNGVGNVGNVGGAAQPISDAAKLRLVALYALRYENHSGSAVAELKRLLVASGVAQEKVAFIDAVLRYAGSRARLAGTEDAGIFAKGKLQRIFREGRNSSDGSIYMQHTPRIDSVVQSAIRGKLRESHYATIDPFGRKEAETTPKEIVVFIVGGATYEEARIVASINEAQEKAGSPVRVILGGTGVVNSAMFMAEVAEAGAEWPADSAAGRIAAKYRQDGGRV